MYYFFLFLHNVSSLLPFSFIDIYITLLFNFVYFSLFQLYISTSPYFYSYNSTYVLNVWLFMLSSAFFTLKAHPFIIVMIYCSYIYSKVPNERFGNSCSRTVSKSSVGTRILPCIFRRMISYKLALGLS